MRTLSIIKPDATRRNISGAINIMIEEKELRIVAQKMIKMSKEMAEKFYAVHKDKAFFPELVQQMSSGRVIVQVLDGENAVEKYRNLMGATNPTNAIDCTIRKTYGLNTGENSVHGSDSEDNAKTEIAFFFSESEIVG